MNSCQEWPNRRGRSNINVWTGHDYAGLVAIVGRCGIPK
jgi:hypothetical protein